MREMRKRRQDRSNGHAKTRHVSNDSSGSTTGLSGGGNESDRISDCVIMPKSRLRKKASLRGFVTPATNDSSDAWESERPRRSKRRQSKNISTSECSAEENKRNPDGILTVDARRSGIRKKDDGHSSGVENLNTSYRSMRRMPSVKTKNGSTKEDTRVTTKKLAKTHIDKDSNAKTTKRPVRGNKSVRGPTKFSNVSPESEASARLGNFTSGKAKTKNTSEIREKIHRRIIETSEGDDSVFESQGEVTNVLRNCSVMSRISETNLSPPQITKNNTDNHLVKQGVDKHHRQSQKSRYQEELLSLIDEEFGTDQYSESDQELTPSTSKERKTPSNHSVLLPDVNPSLVQFTKNGDISDGGIESPSSRKEVNIKLLSLSQKRRSQEELLSLLEEEVGIDPTSGSDLEHTPSTLKKRKALGRRSAVSPQLLETNSSQVTKHDADIRSAEGGMDSSDSGMLNMHQNQAQKNKNREELLSLLEEEFGIDSLSGSDPEPSTSKKHKSVGKSPAISPRISDSDIRLADRGVGSSGSGKDASEKNRSREELLSSLEEKLGIDTLSGSDPEPTPSTSKEQKSVLNKTESKGKNAENKSVPITSFYSSKQLTKKPPRLLNSWLRSKRHDFGNDVIPSDAVPSKPVLDTDAKSADMKLSSTRTPLDIRSVSKLVDSSTPHPASCSDVDCEEDLFGFENLLKPVSRFLEDFSPIPNPELPKKAKRRRYTKTKENGENLEGLLDITNSHLLSSAKTTRKTKHTANTKLDISDIQLFEIEPLEEPKNTEDVFEDDVEPPTPTKPKKTRHPPKPTYTEFDIENALPWDEIMSHELVIESA